MRRRCLDCDSVRDGGPACPACGSPRAVLLAAPDGNSTWGVPSLLLGAHAWLGAFATAGQPGLLLGNAWFAEGLCAALLAVGVERLPRITRLVVAASALIHLLYLVLTPQRLIAGLSVTLLLALVVLLQEDRTKPSVRAARALALALIAIFAAGTIAGAWGHPPPGWWHGEHPALPTMTVPTEAEQR